MLKNPPAFKNSGNNLIVFALSIFTALYWILGQVFNIYYFAFTGAVYELLWLPMIAALFILPIVSVIYFVKDKFNLQSLALYAGVFILSVILFLMFYSSDMWSGSGL